MFLFVLGIPSLFLFIISRNFRAMNSDQRLREINKGQSTEDNPQFLVRQRYQKLYNDFRPGFTFWRLVIMLRKFGLAFVALMFSKNPMFQARCCAEAPSLSLSLLVSLPLTLLCCPLSRLRAAF